MYRIVCTTLAAVLLFAIAVKPTTATDLGECSVGKVTFEVSTDATPEAKRALGVFSIQFDNGNCATISIYKAEGSTVSGRIILGSEGSIPKTDKSFSATVRGDGIIQTTIRYTSRIQTTWRITTIPPGIVVSARNQNGRWKYWMPPVQTYMPEQGLTRYDDVCKLESTVSFSAREASENARNLLGVYASVLNDSGRCFVLIMDDAAGDTVTGRIVLGKKDQWSEQQRGFRALVNEDGSATFGVQFAWDLTTRYTVRLLGGEYLYTMWVRSDNRETGSVQPGPLRSPQYPPSEIARQLGEVEPVPLAPSALK